MIVFEPEIHVAHGEQRVTIGTDIFICRSSYSYFQKGKKKKNFIHCLLPKIFGSPLGTDAQHPRNTAASCSRVLEGPKSLPSHYRESCRLTRVMVVAAHPPSVASPVSFLNPREAHRVFTQLLVPPYSLGTKSSPVSCFCK